MFGQNAQMVYFFSFIHTLFLAIIFHYHKCYYGQIGRGLMEICCTICVLVTWTQGQYEGHNNCVTLCIHPRRNVCFEVCRLEDWRHEAYTNFIFIYFLYIKSSYKLSAKAIFWCHKTFLSRAAIMDSKCYPLKLLKTGFCCKQVPGLAHLGINAIRFLCPKDLSVWLSSETVLTLTFTSKIPIVVLEINQQFSFSKTIYTRRWGK